MPSTAPPAAVSPLSATHFPAAVDDLADLLADTVADGASLGFLSPFAHSDASARWAGRAPAVVEGSGSRCWRSSWSRSTDAPTAWRTGWSPARTRSRPG